MITQVTKSDYSGDPLDSALLNDSSALHMILDDQTDSKKIYTISYSTLSSFQGGQQESIIKTLHQSTNPVVITQAHNAPIYICLHGFGGSEKSFDLLKQSLWSTGHLAIFYTLSLKGHGNRLDSLESLHGDIDQRTSEKIIQHARMKVLRLVDAKDLDSFTLLGHSIGGTIATAVAHDEDVKRYVSSVICLNPAYYRPSLPIYDVLSRIDKYTAKKTKQTQQFFRISKNLIGQKKLDKLGKFLLHYFIKKRLNVLYADKHNPNMNYFFPDYLQQASNPDFLRAFYYTAINLFREDMNWIEDILTSIDTPVYVLHGEKDKRFKRERIEEICEHIAQGGFEVIADLGHNPHEEKPELLAQKILAIQNRLLISQKDPL